MNRYLFVALASVACVSCHASRDAAAVQQTHAYTCPMHPQVHADKPGECPVCGMRLVEAGKKTQPQSEPRKIKLYRSPMNPAQTSPVPMKDDMGMDYVPVYGDEAAASTLTIDPHMQSLIGLTTIAVEVGHLAGGIRTTGRVSANEQRLYKVTPRVEGFVDTLYADFTGKLVKKGDPLLSLYSPELFATEQEYLLALHSRSSLAESGLGDTAASARERLHLLGITEPEIAALEKSGVASRTVRLVAPISGYLTMKNVTAGGKVSPSDPLFEISDLSLVWVFADIYENDLPRLQVGQKASLTLAYWPGRKWSGHVSFIAPSVDASTRTIRARIEIANPTGELKPDMFGDVVIASAAREAMLVPEDAVIDTGQRKIVFVALANGQLQPREIEVGLHAQGKYEVRRGLTQGDMIAVGANFLLDSESRLKGVLPQLLDASSQPTAPERGEQ